MPKQKQCSDSDLKKGALGALAFTVLWVAYCLAAILPNPQHQNPVAIGGLFLGALFMWLTGLALLLGTRRFPFSARAALLTGALLLAADLFAKALVARFLQGGPGITLVPGWLSVNFAPNYSNNVVLNLLGIVVDSGWLHALIKLVAFVAAGAILFFYCRSQKYDLTNGRLLLAAALMASGAASSIVESAFRGYILDFITFASLVSFDIKDLCLMYGVGLFVVVMIEQEKAAAQNKTED